jgi:hypothetical protein
MCLHSVEPFLNILLQLFFRPLTCQFDIKHRRQISTIEFHGTDKKVRLLQGIRTWSEETDLGGAKREKNNVVYINLNKKEIRKWKNMK